MTIYGISFMLGIVLGTSSALWLAAHRQWVSAVRRYRERREERS